MKNKWFTNNFEIDLSHWNTEGKINGKIVHTNEFYWFCMISGYIWIQNWYWIIVYLLDMFHQNLSIHPIKIVMFIFMTFVINVFYYPFLIFGQKITKLGYYANILSFTWLCAYHYTDINSCPNISILIYTIIIDFIIGANLLSMYKKVLSNLLAYHNNSAVIFIIFESALVIMLGLLLYFIPSLLYTGY